MKKRCLECLHSNGRETKERGKSYHGHHLSHLTHSVPHPVVVEAIVDAVNQMILLTVIELHEAVHINNNKIITNYCYIIILLFYSVPIIIVYYNGVFENIV